MRRVRKRPVRTETISASMRPIRTAAWALAGKQPRAQLSLATSRWWHSPIAKPRTQSHGSSSAPSQAAADSRAGPLLSALPRSHVAAGCPSPAGGRGAGAPLPWQPARSPLLERAGAGGRASRICGLSVSGGRACAEAGGALSAGPGGAALPSAVPPARLPGPAMSYGPLDPYRPGAPPPPRDFGGIIQTCSANVQRIAQYSECARAPGGGKWGGPARRRPVRSAAAAWPVGRGPLSSGSHGGAGADRAPARAVPGGPRAGPVAGTGGLAGPWPWTHVSPGLSFLLPAL